MTITDISRRMKTNRNSVAKYLDILLISGHAEMITFGPAKVFFPSRRIPLSSILDFISDFIIVLDKDLRVVQVNENFLTLLDIERESILGNKINDFLKDFLKITEIMPKIKSALDGKKSKIETSFQNDSEKLHFKIKYIPTTFDNGAPGVGLIIEDITKQKRAEKKMLQAINEWKTTFNSITDMISLHDQYLNIVKVNKAFADFFKDTPEKFVGKKCYEIIHGTKKPHLNCPCQQTQLTKKTATFESFEPHMGKYFEISATPITTNEGKNSGFVHIIKDITDRKKA
ncbi:MAG: PAS domain-containing protein [Thermoplasmatales archaeon]|nr:MAG: PAS domain-containing protein [Thermoplasmatales archaeon]